MPEMNERLNCYLIFGTKKVIKKSAFFENTTKKGFITFMKKRMKTLLSMGLTLAMAMSIIGCGQEQQVNTSETKQSEVASVATETVEVDPYEAAEMPKTVTMMTSKGSKIGEEMIDYNDVTSFELIEEYTGTHIEWKLVPGAEYAQKFQLTLASEEYPDLMIYDWKKLGARQAAEDGVIVCLSDYAEYMPNFMEWTKNNPDVAKAYIEEGKIYYLPAIRAEQESCIYYGPVMRTDWLDALGLDAPTDPDSLYEVLTAFKTKDPNGNGEADEIPMSGVGSKNLTYLLTMFGTSREFYAEDGVIKYGPMEESYADGMAYIAKLYDEGLIDEEYIMHKRADLVGKITNNKVGFAYEYQPSAIQRTMAETAPDFKFEGIPHFTNPEGVKVTDYTDYLTRVFQGYGAAISTDCENIEGTLKWLDSFYSEEVVELFNFGEEGVHYNMEGDKHVFTDFMYNNPDFALARQFTRELAAIDICTPGLQLWECYSSTLASSGKEAIETWADVDTSMIVPSALSFTAEETEKISTVYAQIKTYVDERIDKIIMGQESVDILENVRAEITKMGIQDIIDIYQAAYDRFDSIALAE